MFLSEEAGERVESSYWGMEAGFRGRAPLMFYNCAFKVQENPCLNIKMHCILNRIS